MKWAHGGFRALSSRGSEGVRLRTRKRIGKKKRGEKKARSVGSKVSVIGAVKTKNRLSTTNKIE